jgi:hypothetical protein
VVRGAQSAQEFAAEVSGSRFEPSRQTSLTKLQQYENRSWYISLMMPELTGRHGY